MTSGIYGQPLALQIDRHLDNMNLVANASLIHMNFETARLNQPSPEVNLDDFTYDLILVFWSPDTPGIISQVRETSPDTKVLVINAPEDSTPTASDPMVLFLNGPDEHDVHLFYYGAKKLGFKVPKSEEIVREVEQFLGERTSPT